MRKHEPARATTAADDELARADALLWMAVGLGPFAAFTNTLCGFTIAHWVNQVASKMGGFLLDGFDLLLCVTAFGIGLVYRRRFGAAQQDQPFQGRRYFMANLVLLLATLCFLSVLFQTLNMAILHASD